MKRNAADIAADLNAEADRLEARAKALREAAKILTGKGKR